MFRWSRRKEPGLIFNVEEAWGERVEYDALEGD
jgi:hypothetical protein